MERRGFLKGILAAGIAPALITNPMKLWIPSQQISVVAGDLLYTDNAILHALDIERALFFGLKVMGTTFLISTKDQILSSRYKKFETLMNNYDRR